MYTIISGTNRAGSNTIIVAKQYQELLAGKGVNAKFVSLVGLDVLDRNPVFQQLEQDVLIPTTKFVFVSPEYNGSIPGVLKAMFDISDTKKCFWGKKALLTGVSTGRAGNLRGMEHLTGILHFMKVIVHPDKLPISSVDKLLDQNGHLTDQALLAAIDIQLNDFIAF